MAASAPHDADVVIIGAGIIGICCAAHLSEADLRVLVVDRSGVCAETSAGNAAALAFQEVLPLAHKGLWRKLPRWLADPLGPLSIPPAYLPRLLPWLIRFLRAGSASRRQAAVAAQVALMRLAQNEWPALMQRSGTADMLRADGCLELYDSAASFRAAQPDYEMRQRHGIAFDHLDRDGIEALQPGLAPHFRHATFVPEWKTVADPQALGLALWAYAEGHGARFERAAAASVSADAQSTTVALEDGRAITAGHVVIAAGAWSHLLARQSGDRIPLESERGYNTTLPAGAFDLKRQLFFADHGFVATPLAGAIRIGGAVELAGLQRPPNHARSRAMLAKAARFLPGLKTDGGRQWMGHRPSLPDSLPVIGRASAAPRILYAFGHGHLGLTQAAATGRLISALVTAQDLPVDLAPFSPQRF